MSCSLLRSAFIACSSVLEMHVVSVPESLVVIV